MYEGVIPMPLVLELPEPAVLNMPTTMVRKLNSVGWEAGLGVAGR